MRTTITKTLLITALAMNALSASAEGLADRNNENKTLISTLSNQSMLTHAGHHKAAIVEIERKLTYQAGESKKTHPHLTAAQRKHIIFGND